jgi:hypothetical protein
VSEDRVLRRIFEPKKDEITAEWRNYIMRSLMISTPQKYYSGDQIEKNEIGGAYSTCGEGGRRIQGFGKET